MNAWVDNRITGLVGEEWPDTVVGLVVGRTLDKIAELGLRVAIVAELGLGVDIEIAEGTTLVKVRLTKVFMEVVVVGVEVVLGVKLPLQQDVASVPSNEPGGMANDFRELELVSIEILGVVGHSVHK